MIAGVPKTGRAPSSTTENQKLAKSLQHNVSLCDTSPNECVGGQ